MTALLRRPVVLAVLALLALALLATVATAASSGGRGAEPAVAQQVPVAETVVACPGLRSRKGYTESAVAAATPPRADVPGGSQSGGTTSGAEAPDGSGKVRTLTKDPTQSKVLIRLTAPGDRGSYVGRDGERDSVTGLATGALAPGFSVTQTERTVDGGGRGLAGTECLPTGADFWFVGPATGVGQRAVLVLTNPEDATASVDVTFFGRRGVVNAPGARGVQVPARQRVELRLDRLAPAQRVTALHVQVLSGRLSAAVTETDVEGFKPRGTDWFPGAQAPATELVVPGVPKVAKGRDSDVRLDVVAPGEGAVVSLQLVTADGTFVPLSAQSIDVPAESVRSVDLTKALAGQAGTVLLTSDQPVTAGATVLLKRPDYFGDVLYLAAVPALTAPAVVPDNRTTRDMATRLVLTAPEGAATVEVRTFAGGVQGRPIRVEVAAGTTRWLTVPPPQGRRGFGLVLTPLPGSGPVYGVRMLDEEGSRGPLVTAQPLRTARLTVLVPQAVPDIGAGTAG